VIEWARRWLERLDDNERETVEERIAIQMEANGWSEDQSLINLYKERQTKWIES
jgi:hypothetical protein